MSESRFQSFGTNAHSCKHHNKIMWASNTRNNTQFIFLFPLCDYGFHFAGVKNLENKWVSLIFVSWRSSFPGSFAHLRRSADGLQFSEKLKEFGNFGLCGTGGRVPRNHSPPSNSALAFQGRWYLKKRSTALPPFLPKTFPPLNSTPKATESLKVWQDLPETFKV